MVQWMVQWMVQMRLQSLKRTNVCHGAVVTHSPTWTTKTLTTLPMTHGRYKGLCTRPPRPYTSLTLLKVLHQHITLK